MSPSASSSASRAFWRPYEGSPTLLMEHGQIRKQALRDEVLTVAELRLAAHRLGFTDLGEIDRMVLEPAGTFSIQPKDKPADRTDEVLARLAAIEQHVARRG